MKIIHYIIGLGYWYYSRYHVRYFIYINNIRSFHKLTIMFDFRKIEKNDKMKNYRHHVDV